jgi:hypothetical protein
MKKNILIFLLLGITICSFIKTYSQDRVYNNAIKITFLSFITGSTKVTYERATFPRQSFEITGGVIGWGHDKFKVHPKGGLLRLSYKFILYSKSPEPLNGFYVKPEFAFSCFKYDNIFTEGESYRTLSSWGTLMGCVGYQWTRKWLVLDGFGGIGLGIGTKTPLQYHHGFIDRLRCVTLTFGLKVGVAFGKKNKM